MIKIYIQHDIFFYMIYMSLVCVLGEKCHDSYYAKHILWEGDW